MTFWSATRQATAIRSGQTSSRALLEQHLARIAQLNPAINAIIRMDADAARAAADEADRRQAAGTVPGPLHGVPMTIKDAIETADFISTGGAVELRDHLPQRDAPVVKALRDAGAILIGKTNLPRWSGDGQSYNEISGTTSNPWDLARSPGGSSGGAAAAVAAGMAAFDFGTDIGGSIRLPASFCGVFGHKPSWGVVPSTGYLDHQGGGTTEADINVIGPLARAAEDLELLLDVVLRRTGPLVAALRPAPKDVKALRVTAWLDDPSCPVDTSVLDVIHAAVDRLEAAGVRVDRIARPDLDPAYATHVGMWLVSAAMSQSMPPETPGGITHRQWLDMHREREALRARWADFFQNFDAMLMPISFVPPFVHDQSGDIGGRTLACNGQARPYVDLFRWPTFTGMAGLPATVPPLGLNADGLPIGLQVVGPAGGDLTTIRLAGLIAQLCGGFAIPPLVSGV